LVRRGFGRRGFGGRGFVGSARWVSEISVAVRVRPGAGRTRVGGGYPGPHGMELIVAVGAPAVDGKATEAVRRALAEAFGLRNGAVSLRLGVTSRDKVFTLTGDPAALAARLADLRDT
jgi:uncharacterized protein YggU (UPF0235/DUF167 family)